MGAMAWLLLLAPAAQESRAESFSFEPSGAHGGGGMTIIKAVPPDSDPTGDPCLIAGGDVSGIHVSYDCGDSWQSANLGMTTDEELSVAAIEFSPSVAGRVFAAVGKRGNGGGVFLSEDYGANWSRISFDDEVSFSGKRNQNDIEPPFPYPPGGEVARSTGNLLLVDETSDPDEVRVVAGTYESGVWVGKMNTGGSWTWSQLIAPIAGLPLHVRSLSFGSDSSTLFVATLEDGVHQFGVALRPDATLTSHQTVCSDLGTSEELLFHSGTLYIAAGALGVAAHTPGVTACQTVVPESPTETCSVDGSSVDCIKGPYWRSVTVTEGDRDGDGSPDPLLWLGNMNPEHDASFGGDGKKDAIVTVSLPLAPSPTISTEITNASTTNSDHDLAGTTDPWWRGDDRIRIDGVADVKKAANSIGRGSFRAAYLAASPNGDTVYTAGSSASYKLPIADGSVWQPIANQIQLIVGSRMAIEPALGTNPRKVWMGTADWWYLDSIDSMQTVGDWDRSKYGPCSDGDHTAVDFAFHEHFGAGRTTAFLASVKQAETGESGIFRRRERLSGDPSGPSDGSVSCADPTGTDDVADWYRIGEICDFSPESCTPACEADPDSSADCDTDWKPAALAYNHPVLVAAVDRYGRNPADGGADEIGIWAATHPSDSSLDATRSWVRLISEAQAEEMFCGPLTAGGQCENMGSGQVQLSWAGLGEPLYVYHPRSGLWAGHCDALDVASCEWYLDPNLAQPSLVEDTGFIAADPENTDRIWLTTEAGFAKVTFNWVADWSSGSMPPHFTPNPVVVTVTSPDGLQPGPLVAAPGRILMSTLASGSGDDYEPARLVEIFHEDGALNSCFDDVGGDYYADAAINPVDILCLDSTDPCVGMACTGTEDRCLEIGVSLRGSGFIRGTRSTGDSACVGSGS